MFSLNSTLKKSGVGWAMGNETIYLDGLKDNFIRTTRLKFGQELRTK